MEGHRNDTEAVENIEAGEDEMDAFRQAARNVQADLQTARAPLRDKAKR